MISSGAENYILFGLQERGNSIVYTEKVKVTRSPGLFSPQIRFKSKATDDKSIAHNVNSHEKWQITQASRYLSPENGFHRRLELDMQVQQTTFHTGSKAQDLSCQVSLIHFLGQSEFPDEFELEGLVGKSTYRLFGNVDLER